MRLVILSALIRGNCLPKLNFAATVFLDEEDEEDENERDGEPGGQASEAATEEALAETKERAPGTQQKQI